MAKANQFCKPKKIRILFSLLFLAVLSPITFYPHVDRVSESLGQKIKNKLNGFGVGYVEWDWDANIKLSGLPLHLIQTSKLDIPPSPTEQEISFFSSLEKRKRLPIANPPKNIIFILCESCWYNNNFFKNEFTPLDQFSFKRFRAISPVYGGVTVNASFELLTGLPANGKLKGTIYSNYASLFKEDAEAFPRALKKRGYSTVAIHNHFRTFWRRDIINPKIGFDNFISLEDMNYKGEIWADDRVLFSKALEEIKKSKRPGFYYLVTAFTHGGYHVDNDHGEGDCSKRLRQSILQMSEFVQEALRIEPNSAILIIGDHKPALTKFFFDNGILPNAVFSETGDRNEDFKFVARPPRENIGDMPALFYHPDIDRSAEFVGKADNLPFYCISNLFDQIYVGVELPSFEFSRESGVCSNINSRDYYERAEIFPEFLFSLSLFKNGLL